jgi:hypothetical protein
MCWTPLCVNNTNNLTIHESSYKHLEVKTNRTSFYAEIATDITTRNSERKDTCVLNYSITILFINTISEACCQVFVTRHI